MLNTGLFFAKVSVKDTGIIEAIIGFFVYIVLVCVGVAVLICKLENIGTKRSCVSDKEATKKTVGNYIKRHTDGYGSFRPESGDVWRCSFCKEWEAMSYKQCNKCGQVRTYRDKVKYAKKRK